MAVNKASTRLQTSGERQSCVSWIAGNVWNFRQYRLSSRHKTIKNTNDFRHIVGWERGEREREREREADRQAGKDRQTDR